MTGRWLNILNFKVLESTLENCFLGQELIRSPDNFLTNGGVPAFLKAFDVNEEFTNWYHSTQPNLKIKYVQDHHRYITTIFLSFENTADETMFILKFS